MNAATDRSVLDLWSERASLKAIANQAHAEWEAKREQLDVEEALSERSEVADEALTDCEVKIENHLGSSVFALAATLIVTIGDEAVPRLHRAALAAIRPQLVGLIAQDADRVLAQDGEARA